MKLAVQEEESNRLAAFLREVRPRLFTSRISTVEVLRAASLANPSAKSWAAGRRALGECDLVDVTQELLENAARLASRELRTLDAIHLATAQSLAVDGIVTYDRRLAEAARGEHFVVHQP